MKKKCSFQPENYGNDQFDGIKRIINKDGLKAAVKKKKTKSESMWV